MRTLYIHFGLPKTGTTTIQNTLYAYRKQLLAEEGFLYPSLQANLTTPLCTIFQDAPHNHIENRVQGRSSTELDELKNAHLSALEEDLRDNDWHSALLSAEGLSNLRPVEIIRLRDWAESLAENIVVLYCVREPVSHTRSVIQQLIKGGDLLSELYANPPLPNFQGKIHAAARIFGKERLRIFDFESDITSEHGLVHAFSRRTGLSDSTARTLATNAKVDNESMSMQGALLLDRINNRHPMFIDGVKSSKRSWRQLEKALRVKGEKFDIPADVKRHIYERTRDDVTWLNSFFDLALYQEPLSFDQPDREEQSEGFFFKNLTIDSLADILADE